MFRDDSLSRKYISMLKDQYWILFEKKRNKTALIFVRFLFLNQSTVISEIKNDEIENE